MLTKEELIDFENDIKSIYDSGKIAAPVHLDNGSEEALIEIFKNVKKDDWIMCSWRSHYRCLLKGVPKEQVKQDILDKQSITLCYPEYKVYSSAIVGGIIPIALGVALSNKLKNNDDTVWVFCGDMTAETGAFYEALKYAANHKLKMKFVIENNQKSVCTPTMDVWKLEETTFKNHSLVEYFEYESQYPHAGGGKRINF